MTLLTEPTRIVLAKGQPVPNDPNFAFNSLLLHGNGTNGSTAITDSSGSPKAVTAVGNAQISTAIADPFGNSTGVLAFDGATDYLTVPDSGTLQMGTGDFTIESWVYFNTLTDYRTLFDKGVVSTGALLLQTDSNNGRMIVWIQGVPSITEGSNGSTGAWTHYALSRSSGTLKLFRNGSQTGSVANSTNFNSSAAVGIGAYASTAEVGLYGLNGYIDDLRITKGVARYTSNFTPPTLPFPDF